MTGRQYDVLFALMTSVNNKQDKILAGLEKVEKGFNSLPEGSEITGKLSKIINEIKIEIESIKDEINA